MKLELQYYVRNISKTEPHHNTSGNMNFGFQSCRPNTVSILVAFLVGYTVRPLFQAPIVDFNTSTKTSKLADLTPKIFPDKFSPADAITITDFVVIPMDIFSPCKDRILRLTCLETIFLERHEILPLLQASDESSQEIICQELLETRSNNPDPYNTGVEVPVCIQSLRTFGILTISNITDGQKPSTGDSISLRMVQSIATKHSENGEDKHKSNGEVRVRFALQNYIDRTEGVRVIQVKNVDFPMYYHRPRYEEQKELYRDDNYGNMVWRYASTMILNQATTKFNTERKSDNWFSYNISAEDKSKRADALVIATANTFHLTKEPQLEDLITAMTQRVIQRNVSTIVIGLGIQADFDSDDDAVQQQKVESMELPHTFQKRLIEEISQHQSIPAIGVRGDLTARICRNSGVNNCVSMGCPSLTISRDTNLGQTLQSKWNRVYDILEKMETQMKKQEPTKHRLKIALTSPANVWIEVRNNAVWAVMEMMAVLLEQHGHEVTIISQTPTTVNEVTNFLKDEWSDVRKSKKYNTAPFTEQLMSNLSNVQFEEYYSVEDWLKGASKFDLCISSRIHGSMTFIGSGVPTVAIPTDFRIMELLHSMKIPFVLPTVIRTLLTETQQQQEDQASNTNTSLLALALMKHAENTDFEEFEKNRRSKIRGWKAILDDAGLEMDPALLNIIHKV